MIAICIESKGFKLQHIVALMNETLSIFYIMTNPVNVY